MNAASGPSPWRRWTRWASVAGLLWLTGCFDVCGGEYDLRVLDRELRDHEYASAEFVWPHVRTVVVSRGTNPLPAEPPAGDEWVIAPPDPTGFSQGSYRVRLERVGAGPAVRFRAEFRAAPDRDYATNDEMNLDLLRAADPAAAAPFVHRKDEAFARINRGCKPGMDAGCAVLGACWRAGGGQGCD